MLPKPSIIGKRVPSKEGRPKVTGKEKYARDRDVVGALRMQVLRSPHPHAKIRKIDVRKAKALPGVRAVLTHEDVETQGVIQCPVFDWKGRILEDRVRYVGDEVAAIAAETEEIASKALDLIEVAYEKLPAVFDIEEALKPGAPDVRGTGTNIISSPPEPGFFSSHKEWGDIKRGFEESDAIVETETRTSRQYGTFMPLACTAEWTDGRLTIVLSHQSAHEVREVVCRALDMPQNRVRIICPVMPGTFGTFSSHHRIWFLAALLAKKAGRPVSYKMSLEELGMYKTRDSDIIRVKMGAKKDGTVTAVDYEHLQDNGAYGVRTTGYAFHVDNFSRSNVRYNNYGVATNKVSTGCIRGVGDVPQVAAIGQAGDTLAEKLGIDPLTFWKKNHMKSGDELRLADTPGCSLSSEAYDQLIDKGAKAIDWGRKWKGWGQPYEVIGPKRRGVGIVIGTHCSGVTLLPASAEIHILHDGTAQVLIGSNDLGTDSKTSFAQIAAEILGFKLEDVYVVKDVDTETVPYMSQTGASHSLHFGGSVVRLAAEDAKRQLLEMANSAPWSPKTVRQGVDNLDIKDGMIYVKGDPSRYVAARDIIGPFSAPIVIGRASRHDIPFCGPTAQQTMVGFADVEVDTETGKVEVLKLFAGHDSGRIINVAACENQVLGGVLQSCGYALTEDIAFDPMTGKPLNPALTDYWMPTSLDMPLVDYAFADNIDPASALGTKGLGESPHCYPHQAIQSAIYNAIGVRIHQFPLTPDRILKALGKIE